MYKLTNEQSLKKHPKSNAQKTKKQKWKYFFICEILFYILTYIEFCSLCAKYCEFKMEVSEDLPPRGVVRNGLLSNQSVCDNLWLQTHPSI